MSGFRGDYCPGGMGPRTRRKHLARYNGRKGGIASGKKRRQLAKGRRRTRDGGLGVPKAYAPVPWLSVRQLEAVFRAQCDLEQRRFHARGFDTFCAAYRVLKRWQEAKGQDFEITNENVTVALLAARKPHSRRTVQYTRQRLERAGILTCHHVRRSGPRRIKGQMDTVRVRLRRCRCSKDCTPPLRGTGKPAVRRAGFPVVKSERNLEYDRSTSLSPPAADGVAASRRDVNDGTERAAGGGLVGYLAAVDSGSIERQQPLTAFEVAFRRRNGLPVPDGADDVPAVRRELRVSPSGQERLEAARLRLMRLGVQATAASGPRRGPRRG